MLALCGSAWYQAFSHFSATWLYHLELLLQKYYILTCRWPLIIDSSKQSAVFLRYRDTNYLDVCNPKHMDAETIRMSLIGAIR